MLSHTLAQVHVRHAHTGSVSPRCGDSEQPLGGGFTGNKSVFIMCTDSAIWPNLPKLTNQWGDRSIGVEISNLGRTVNTTALAGADWNVIVSSKGTKGIGARLVGGPNYQVQVGLDTKDGLTTNTGFFVRISGESKIMIGSSTSSLGVKWAKGDLVRVVLQSGNVVAFLTRADGITSSVLHTWSETAPKSLFGKLAMHGKSCAGLQGIMTANISGDFVSHTSMLVHVLK